MSVHQFPAKLTSILDVEMLCDVCGWRGKLIECKPDVDGDGAPGCPVADCGGICKSTEQQTKNVRVKKKERNVDKD